MYSMVTLNGFKDPFNDNKNLMLYVKPDECAYAYFDKQIKTIVRIVYYQKPTEGCKIQYLKDIHLVPYRTNNYPGFARMPEKYYDLAFYIASAFRTLQK